MPQRPFAAQTLLDSLLSASAVHIAPVHILDGLDWQLAGVLPEQVPHSIFQVTNHVIYWQDLFLLGLQSSTMRGPENAQDGWPGTQAPSTKEEWDTTVAHYKQGLQYAQDAIHAEDPLISIPATAQTSRLDVLTTLALHNSYHIGQIALLRRMLNAWPPPSGAHTW